MFRIPTILFSSAIIFSATWIIWAIAIPAEEDRQEYRQLMESAKPSKDTSTPPTHSSKQARHQVQRTLMWSGPVGRLEALVRYDSSDFVLNGDQNGRSMVESMYRVTGYIQEELYYRLKDGRELIPQGNERWKLRSGEQYSPTPSDKSGWHPMQVVRYFEADHATYDYSADLFAAEEATLIRFKAPGHLLATTTRGYPALFQGAAKRVEFSLAGESPHFKAFGLKAQLSTVRGL